MHAVLPERAATRANDAPDLSQCSRRNVAAAVVAAPAATPLAARSLRCLRCLQVLAAHLSRRLDQQAVGHWAVVLRTQEHVHPGAAERMDVQRKLHMLDSHHHYPERTLPRRLLSLRPLPPPPQPPARKSSLAGQRWA
jgi:hypothetical protein